MRLFPFFVLLLASCSHQPRPSAAMSAAPAASALVVAAPDRSAADVAMDSGRHPAAFLDFIALQPGMRVGELFAGTGYTTELLARAVAPNGTVFAQNSKWVLERFAEKPWSERLAKDAMKPVVRIDRELDAPFPPEASALDRVVSNANYHDAVWLKVDRPAMNAAVFQSLKRGGRYVICDSSSAPGAGLSVAESLHRIDEAVVRSEVQAAGFRLAAEGDFLRNPEDRRDWSASPGAAGERRGTSDRFCLAFEKP